MLASALELQSLGQVSRFLFTVVSGGLLVS